MSSRSFTLAATAIAALLSSSSTYADADESRVGPPLAEYEKVTSRAIEYLRTKGQAEDGSYSSYAGPGVTALVTAALIEAGRGPSDPTVAKALKYLESTARKDGGLYAENSKHRNYETCMAIMCLAAANKDGRYDKLIKGGEAYLRGVQWSEDNGHDEDSEFHGGGGYGSSSRRDLSNTAFMIDALRAAGVDENDPALKRALIFVSRCQNLESPHNTTPFAAKVNDGGFYYTPAAGGQGQNTPNGGLRSYGAMTYAGLKSMIYAGVKADDPRVKAALKWIQMNYTVDSNPGMGDNGLFYFYHTFAKSLDVADLDYVTDATGKKHDWRDDLFNELKKRQRDDGSWVNENERWLEGDANLVTRILPFGTDALPAKVGRRKPNPAA